MTVEKNAILSLLELCLKRYIRGDDCHRKVSVVSSEDGYDYMIHLSDLSNLLFSGDALSSHGEIITIENKDVVDDDHRMYNFTVSFDVNSLYFTLTII